MGPTNCNSNLYIYMYEKMGAFIRLYGSFDMLKISGEGTLVIM